MIVSRDVNTTKIIISIYQITQIPLGTMFGYTFNIITQYNHDSLGDKLRDTYPIIGFLLESVTASYVPSFIKPLHWLENDHLDKLESQSWRLIFCCQLPLCQISWFLLTNMIFLFLQSYNTTFFSQMCWNKTWSQKYQFSFAF